MADVQEGCSRRNEPDINLAKCLKSIHSVVRLGQTIKANDVVWLYNKGKGKPRVRLGRYLPCIPNRSSGVAFAFRTLTLGSRTSTQRA